MEKEGKIRLGKVEVKMGDKTVTLTVDQARELCALLKGLFGDDATRIIHVRDYWYPRPWYGWEYRGNHWQTGVVYCSDNVSHGGGSGGARGGGGASSVSNAAEYGNATMTFSLSGK